MSLYAENREAHPIPRLIRRLLLTAIFAPLFLGARTGNPVTSEMLVSTDWLATHLHDSNLIVLCIVDEDSFYSSGHIRGARMIRRSEIMTIRAGIPNELPSPEHLQRVFENVGVSNGSRIILYGERSGMLAARAYFTLDYLGLADRAALLDGGIEKWRAERRPESVATPVISVGKLDILTHPEIVVGLSQMTEYAQSDDATAVLMDARPTAEYNGQKLSEDVSKPGHIPHAVGLYWRDLLREGSIPELKSIGELQELFRAAGVTQGKEVITYCRTGMQSSFSYFVAKYLGHKTRMYDGSFYEWSRSPLPVER